MRIATQRQDPEVQRLILRAGRSPPGLQRLLGPSFGRPIASPLLGRARGGQELPSASVASLGKSESTSLDFRIEHRLLEDGGRALDGEQRRSPPARTIEQVPPVSACCVPVPRAIRAALPRWPGSVDSHRSGEDTPSGCAAVTWTSPAPRQYLVLLNGLRGRTLVRLTRSPSPARRGTRGDATLPREVLFQARATRPALPDEAPGLDQPDKASPSLSADPGAGRRRAGERRSAAPRPALPVGQTAGPSSTART